MATLFDEIIRTIEKDYPMQPMTSIGNISDLDVEAQMNVTNQYIIGLTTNDPYGGGIDHYKYQMKATLKEVTENFRVLAWPFEMDEIEAVRAVLTDLAKYFSANLDIDKMIDRIRRIKANHLYITITVVMIPMFHA